MKIKLVRNWYKNMIHTIKRFLEVLISIIILLISFPIILIIILVIKLNFKDGPVIFQQERVGKNGKLFRIYKFRTMINNAEKKLENILINNSLLRNEYQKSCKLENDPRIIGKIGIFLRKNSLDEVPQLINIIKGEMTFVGPRPFLQKEIFRLKNDYKKLYSIKPGLTGLWQISGRNNLTLEERVKLDIKYINNKSMTNDTIIIFKTLIVLFQKKGAY